jgi:hypothetical protein
MKKNVFVALLGLSLSVPVATIQAQIVKTAPSVLISGKSGTTSTMIAELTPNSAYKTFGSSSGETYLSRAGLSLYSVRFTNAGSENLSTASANNEVYFDATDESVAQIELIAQSGTSSESGNEYFVVLYGEKDSNSSTTSTMYLEDEDDATVTADDVSCQSSTSNAAFKIISGTFTVPSSTDGTDNRRLEIKANGTCRGEITKVQVFRVTS